MKKLFTIALTLGVFYSAFGLAEKSATTTAAQRTDQKKTSLTSKGDVSFTPVSAGIDLSFIGPMAPNCPLTADPVCGNNGVTYLNACFAQAAGITQYASGVCFSTCINPAAIQLNAVCTQVYDPVCGCNGVTYQNACTAQKNGVTSYTAGPCANSCYNASLIFSGGGVALNPNTGVLTLACAPTNTPVCGCNGITYANPCTAQANGISFYTYGTCQTGCINPALMNPNANCPGTLAPVCGCNGVTYPNVCSASAAGVTSFTQGSCSGVSGWCNKAVPISCGDYLPFETTVGAGNSINTYPGCSNSTFAGPEKVYMLHKTTPGDLQIGLEIMTPGLDLDMFLLAGNCSQLTCLRSSTTNNSQTNNEGILLTNAPIGIYYIVVDGQFANSQGQYRLEVSCGYLDCSQAIPLQCGVPLNHTNLNGADNVSLYGCDGNIYNVENNGPEVVHTFVTTTTGWVNITLSNLQGNLELFLLRSCDRGGCVDFSESPGTTPEQITAYLQPGTYYVVVDGYNGAVSPYTLRVDCVAGCSMSLAGVTPTAANCGQSNGSISLVTSGGAPGYVIQYTGPVSGVLSSSSNNNTIQGLPAGQYQVRITDVSGCVVNQTVIVPSNSPMAVGVNLTTAICNQGGTAQFTMTNGTQPYSIQLSGPVSGNYNAGNANPYTITGLTAGNYVAYIRDAQGCVVVRTFTISYSSGNFSFTGTPTAATCNAPGSILVNTSNGTPPYNITVSGPVSGNLTSNTNQFTIANLPGGTYTVTIGSSGQCQFTRTIVVPNTGLQVSVTGQSGACNQPGSIAVQVQSGTAPYTITWNGPSSGSITTSNANYQIAGLPSGNYGVQVRDATNCLRYEVVNIQNSSGALSATFSAISSGCTATGAIAVQINNGNPQYVISWSGPVSGTITTSSPNYTISNLPGGAYLMQVTDASGCSRTGMVSVSAGNGLSVTPTVNNAGCGQNGSINLAIAGGTAPYSISWSGQVSGSATTSNATYTIPNLPGGTYSIIVTATGGCQWQQNVTVTSSGGGNFSVSLMPIAPSCQTCAAIWVDIYGGQAPYTLTWSGPTPGSLVTSQTNFDIYCVNPGTYTVVVTDANGCSTSGTVVISPSSTSLQINTNITPADCIMSASGSVYFNILNGQPNFTVIWTGPVSGNWNTSLREFSIYNLPSGNYTFTITDANNCVLTIPIVMTNSLGVVITPVPAPCGQLGSLWVDIPGGLPPYTVTWTGPSSGTTTINNNGLSIPNLPAGTYTVTVTSSNGCSQTVQSTLTTSGSIVCTALAVPGQCGANGSIHVGITSGTPGFTLTWTGPVSGSATTNNFFYNINNLPNGTYTVTVTDASGCTCTHTVTVQNGGGNVGLVVTPVPGNCAQNGSLWVDIPGGTPPYVLTWTGPVSGSITLTVNGYSIPNLPSGTYTVTVTDANGCTRSQTVTLSNTGGNPTVSLTPINGICGLPGSIGVQIGGGTGPFTITWAGPVSGSASTPLSTYTINNLPSGTYTVTVIGSNGCSGSNTVTINNSGNGLVIVGQAEPGDCGMNGAIWLDIIGGSPYFTITWTGPVNGTTTFSNFGYLITGLPNGTYQVRVTDFYGCTSNVLVVTVNSGTMPNLTATPQPGLCGQNGSIALNISGSPAPYMITWTGPVSGMLNNAPANHTLTNLPSGTYTITVKDANDCSKTQVVTLNNGTNMQITAVPVPGVCGMPGAIHIGMSGGTAPFTVVWTGPVNGSASTNNFFYNINNLPSGTYTITVTDATGCTRTQTVILNNGVNNVNFMATAVPSLCGGTGVININITGGTGPFQLMWTGPVSGSTTLISNTFTLSNLPSGTYTLKVTDVQGCMFTRIVTLTNTGSPIVIVGQAENGDCGMNGAIWLDIIGGSPFFTITWTGPVNGSTVFSNFGYLITGLPNGTYQVRVTDFYGCTSNVLVVTVNSGTMPNLTLTPQHGLCGQPGSVLVNISGAPGPYMITWSGPVNGMVNNAPANYTLTNLPSGTYSVTVKDINGCTKTQNVTLNNAGNNLQITAVGIPGLCGQPGSIHVGMSGGSAPFTVVWTGPVNGSATTNNFFYNINNLPSGTYTITVTDANGCIRTQTLILNNGANNLNITAVAVPGVCGQPGSIHVGINNGTAPFTVVWTGPVNGSAPTNNFFYNINNLPSGTYTVTVTDANGCTRIQTVILNNGNSNVQLVITPVPGTCGNTGSLWVDIIGGVAPWQLMWNGPVNGMITLTTNGYSIPNLPSGTYTVKVTDAQGCMHTVTVTLNNGANNLNITAVAVPGVCGAPGQIHVGITGGTAPFTVSWTGPQNGSASTSNNFYNILNLTSGTYTVTVTDANGCTRTQTVILNNGANNLQVTLTPVPGICVQTGQIQVGIAGGTAPYTVSWTGPQNGMATTNTGSYTIMNLPSGAYTVTVTDANGCTATQTTTLNNGGIVTLTAAPANGICGQNGSIQLTMTGGAAPYALSWTGPVSGNATANGGAYTITNLPSGTYTITATSGANCVSTQTSTLNNGSVFNMTVVSNPGFCNINGSVVLTFSEGQPPIAITWSGPVNGSATTSGNSYTLSNLPTGTYTITATTAQGCTDTETITLNNATNMLTVTGTPVNGLCGEPGSVTLSMTGGTGPYTIAWTGASSGSTTSANALVTIPNLGTGTYSFTVTSANGCVQSTSASVQVTESDIDITSTANTGNCGESGSIQVIISGGNPGYVINWSGPESGSFTTSGSTYVINGTTAGDYNISVTDAQGCTETTSVTLNNPEADLDILLSRMNGICSGPGAVTVSIISGDAPFNIVWTGPVNGSTTTSNSSFTINNAPAGTYTVTVTDVDGCTDTGTITVTTTPNVVATTIAQNGVCGMPGSIILNLVGGTAPYTIAWTGAASGSVTSQTTTRTFNNLGSGTYNFTVTDANGCVATTTAVLNNSGNIFTINAFPYHGTCGDLGRIRVNMFGGTGPFLITWVGPSSGSATTSATTYDILNLPSGMYFVSVTDAAGCTGTDVEMITNSNTSSINVSVTAINGLCGDLGSIWITVLQGQGPFVITWTGPQSGQITTSSTDFDIPNLPNGTYTVTIRDVNLCERTYTVVVTSAPDNLNVTLTANNNTCGNPGSITVNIAGNAPPYIINWNSAIGSGTQTVSTNTFTIPNLFTGNYTVQVVDANGCSETHTRQLYNEAGTFIMTLTPNVGGCNNQSSIQASISGGQAPFLLNWTGPSSNGSVTFTTSTYNLFGLAPGFYMIMITDANGCSQWETVQVSYASSPPITAFAFTTNLLTANFTNQSSPGTYLWSFGDGTTSTAANPVHTYAQDGTYTVCLIVSNACGSTTHCANVTVTIPNNMVILDIGENSGAAGGNVLVPVRIRNCNLLVSLAGSLTVQNPSVASIAGVAPAAIAPQFNPVNKTFNYYANNGQGVSLQQNQILFYLIVQLTGTPGQSTNLSFANSPLAVEVGSMVNGNPVALPHITYTGSVSISTAVQVSGDVYTYWDAPIPDAEVRISNTGMDMMEMTDDAGRYMAPDVPMGEMITITPSKNGHPANGLSTYALFIGQRFILGMEPPQVASPYQVIAGDANCNGAFTTLDLFIIQQLIIGVRDSFANCPAWVFVAANSNLPESDFDAYNVFPYANCDSMMVTGDALADFVGVKVGDILGHANPANFTNGGGIEPRSAAELVLTTNNRQAQQGDLISIPVRSSNFEDITNYQLGLWFDTQYLTFEGFDPAASGALSSVVAGTTQTGNGRLSVSWFNLAGTGINAADDEVLFTVRFRANANISDLNGLLEVRSQWILSEAYNTLEERKGIILNIENQAVTSANEPLEGKGIFRLHQNAPNPFVAETSISFDLPEASDVELLITDQLGRTVRILRGQYPQGRSTMDFKAEELPQGVYRYTLKAGEFSATRTMILVK